VGHPLNYQFLVFTLPVRSLGNFLGILIDHSPQNQFNISLSLPNEDRSQTFIFEYGTHRFINADVSIALSMNPPHRIAGILERLILDA
jgi:hypothetical protein